MADIGHNGELKAFVERIERLEEEKKALADDISEVFKEAKDRGFDTKIMKEVIKLRKLDHAERKQREALIETYMGALGMLADTPLGKAALERAQA